MQRFVRKKISFYPELKSNFSFYKIIGNATSLSTLLPLCWPVGWSVARYISPWQFLNVDFYLCLFLYDCTIVHIYLSIQVKVSISTTWVGRCTPSASRTRPSSCSPVTATTTTASIRQPSARSRPVAASKFSTTRLGWCLKAAVTVYKMAYNNSCAPNNNFLAFSKIRTKYQKKKTHRKNLRPLGDCRTKNQNRPVSFSL